MTSSVLAIRAVASIRMWLRMCFMREVSRRKSDHVEAFGVDVGAGDIESSRPPVVWGRRDKRATIRANLCAKVRKWVDTLSPVG